MRPWIVPGRRTASSAGAPDMADGSPARRHRRRQPLGLPVPREGVDDPRAAGHPVRAARRVGPSDAGPPVPLRRDGRGPRDPGDHRGRRRRGPPAGDARRQDDAAGDRGARSRPSTSAGSTRCSRSSRCRAGSRSRPWPSATPRTRRCSPPRSSPCPTRPSRHGVVERREAQTEAVLGDPSQRGAAPGLTGLPAGDAAARRSARVDSPEMDDERWEPGMPALDRQPVRAPAGVSSLPPSLQGLPPRSVPETAPTPLQKHYVLLCAPALVAGFIAITALEIGAGLGSPLVKLCVLIAAPLLLVTTAGRDAADLARGVGVDAGRSQQGPVPAGVGRREPRVPRADRRGHGPGHRGLGWSAD